MVDVAVANVTKWLMEQRPEVQRTLDLAVELHRLFYFFTYIWLYRYLCRTLGS